MQVDDQLFIDVDSLQVAIDNEIIFKEDNIKDIKELERINLKDLKTLESLILDLNIDEDIDISLENDVPKARSKIGMLFSTIRSISRFVFKYVSISFKSLWTWATRGRMYTLKTPIGISVGFNLRLVILLLISYIVAARQYSKMKVMREHRRKIKKEKEASRSNENYNDIYSLESTEDKVIKVIKESELLSVISAYENVIKSCEKILDKLSTFSYNDVKEIEKDINDKDMDTLQLSIDGKSIKRERIRMERDTIKNLGYSTDMKKYEKMQEDIFKKYEEFIKKEVSFVPKTQLKNLSVREVAKIVRLTDKLVYSSYIVSDYHLSRAIRSISYSS